VLNLTDIFFTIEDVLFKFLPTFGVADFFFTYSDYKFVYFYF